jgi:energy-coupling factor transporter ATP-binding protein EcfA2
MSRRLLPPEKGRKFSAFVIGVLLAALGIGIYMGASWTPLQSHYFATYVSSSGLTGKGTYLFLDVLYPSGWRVASNQDVVLDNGWSVGPLPKLPFALSEHARLAGAKTLAWRQYLQLDNATAYEWLRTGVYENQTPWEMIGWPVSLGGVFVLVLVLGVSRRDRRARAKTEEGHTLRGPRLVTCSDFNRVKHSDGIGFAILEPRRPGSRFFGRGGGSERSIVRIPRDEESSHFVLMGDSGCGKSSLIRQMLLQIRERGETAVVFDPELEFTPQFYDPTADVILNPTDQRMPFWTPSDEVQYPPEAMALAESLFPDKPRDNTFFTEAARKIFAHLLRYRPTPQDLTAWMKNMEEIDRRIAGTELEAMIPKGAAGQRGAVQGTLNQAAAAFQLLPNQEEGKDRWTAAAWAPARKGWLFLPSTPTLRESVKPLVSMWLDSLILRLMESRQRTTAAVWFVVDELATLQRLPQLPTAVTQGRKANIRLVLGLQGRSQLETLYGGQAEVMLSQPMTKIFMRTSEPDAAHWISRSIGEIEIMRLEETHTQNIPHFFEWIRRSKSQHWQRRTEPLVMSSTIEGLANLTGYIKSRELVVAATFAGGRSAAPSGIFATSVATSRVLASAKGEARSRCGNSRW